MFIAIHLISHGAPKERNVSAGEAINMLLLQSKSARKERHTLGRKERRYPGRTRDRHKETLKTLPFSRILL